MKKIYHFMFVLFLACSYTNHCFAQSSDQYGELPNEEAIQRSYKHLQQPLCRVDGLVYQQDERGEYWQVDTSMMIARVNGNLIPEDIDWKVDKLGFAEIPVPEDILIEDFAMSLWNLPWVVTASYITYAKFAGDPMGIQKTIAKKDKQFSSGCYDLTGRPASTPFRGIYVRDGKKVLVK